MRVLLTFAVLLLLSACTADYNNGFICSRDDLSSLYHNKQHLSKNVCLDVTHVQKKGGKLVPDEMTITGRKWVGHDIHTVDKVDRIPLIKNQGFEVLFLLENKYKKLESVTLQVEFPTMITPEGKKLSSIQREQETDSFNELTIVNFSYLFDHDWELIEGEWIIKIFHNNKLLGKAIVETYTVNPE